MMFLQGAHIPHAFGHEICISLSSLQIEASEGQLEEISSHLQTLHVWGHNFLKAGISQLFVFAMHETSWSLQSKPTSWTILNYVAKQNHKIIIFLYFQKYRQYPKMVTITRMLVAIFRFCYISYTVLSTMRGLHQFWSIRGSGTITTRLWTFRPFFPVAQFTIHYTDTVILGNDFVAWRL